MLGRNSAPQNAVRDVMSHLVQNGVTDAAVVETRLTAADGDNFDADVVYFDLSSRARVILEVSIVTISDRIHHWVEVHELDYMESMRSCGRGRRRSATMALTGVC